MSILIIVFPTKVISNHHCQSIDLPLILQIRYEEYVLCGAEDYVLQQVRRLLLPDRTDLDRVACVAFYPDMTLPSTSSDWVSAAQI